MGNSWLGNPLERTTIGRTFMHMARAPQTIFLTVKPARPGMVVSLFPAEATGQLSNKPEPHHPFYALMIS